MFGPILVGAAILGFIAWVAGEKKTGVTGSGIGNDLDAPQQPVAYLPPGTPPTKLSFRRRHR